MGMAAGQARFLGLTARKTNVEYEGQQINQQRTTLSNQSASYNNQLLGLDVPTAPSTDAFTKTTYTWSQNGGTRKNTIQNLVPKAGNNPERFVISYSFTQDSNEGFQTTREASIARKYIAEVPAVGTVGQPGYKPAVAAHYDYSRGGKALTSPTIDETESLQTIDGFKSDKFYCYEDENHVKTFFAEKDINGGAPAPATGGQDGIADGNIFQIGSHSENKYVKDQEVSIELDAKGRMTNLIDSNGRKYALTATTSTDEAGYNDAMSNYDYQKSKYTKQLENVNAKISIIQSQDKSLELKLKQCDTEQQAISTEMDSVKKVIDKNIESSFKTFSA